MKKVIYILFIVLIISSCSTVSVEMLEDYVLSQENSDPIKLKRAFHSHADQFEFSNNGKYLFFIESHYYAEKSLFSENRLLTDSIIACELSTGRLNKIGSASDFNGTRIHNLKISNNNKKIAFTVFNKDHYSGVYITDIEKKITAKVGIEKTDRPSVIFFSPDSKNLFIETKADTLKVWNIERKGFTEIINIKKYLGILGHSDDKSLMALQSENSFGRILETNTMTEICKIINPEDQISDWDPHSLVINEKTIVFIGKRSESASAEIFIRDLKTKSLTAVTDIDRRKKFFLQPDSNYLIIQRETGEWESLNLETGKKHDRGEKITNIAFSTSDNEVLVITNNGHTINIIDLDKPNMVRGKIQDDNEILSAQFIQNNQTILLETEESLIFYNIASEKKFKTIEYINRGYAKNNQLLCYASEDGFKIMDLFFNIELAEYILIDENEYIIKQSGREFIVSEGLSNLYDDADSITKINLLEPVSPPMISIGNINISKPFLMEEENVELTVEVINSGSGISRNLVMEIKSSDGLTVTTAPKIMPVEASGGKQSVVLNITTEKGIEPGPAKIAIKFIEKDFGIRIQGKSVTFQIIPIPVPEVILAKHVAIEVDSPNFNNKIDTNEKINVSFYIQNIGMAETYIENYEIENRQRGVNFMGYFNKANIISEQPLIDKLEPGEYVEITQQYFINSDFRASELRFNIDIDAGIDGRFRLSKAIIPVNKEFSEHGRLRVVSTSELNKPRTVAIQNIESSNTTNTSTILESSQTVSKDAPYIIVFDIESKEGLGSEAKYITGIITETINNSSLYRIVARSEREELMKELSFSQSSLSIEKNTLEIGKMVQANFMVFGSVDHLQDGYLVTMKMVKTETGELVSSRQSYIRRFEELPDVIPQITLEMIIY